MVKPVDNWNEKDKVSLSEFFIGLEEVPKLYADALDLHQKTQADVKAKKKFLKPIEQLSPKGLALVSYLYSVKDKSETQPLIASTVESLENIIKLIDDAPPGTSVTVIFQATDYENVGIRYSGTVNMVHKTVFKFERTPTSVRMINMDSLPGGENLISGPAFFGGAFANSILSTNAVDKNRKVTDLEFAYQQDIKVPISEVKKEKLKEQGVDFNELENLSRQKDAYQCGIYALRDARLLNRNQNFMNNVFSEASESKVRQYQLPPEHMKSIQSRGDIQSILNDPLLRESVVNRKNKTLEQVFTKHSEHGYVNYFSEKYKNVVTEFVNTHSAQEVKQGVEKFDASKMTLETLVERYGPQTHELKAVEQKETTLQVEEMIKKSPVPVIRQLPKIPQNIEFSNARENTVLSNSTTKENQAPNIRKLPKVPQNSVISTKEHHGKPINRELPKIPHKTVSPNVGKNDTDVKQMILDVKAELSKSTNKEHQGMLITNAKIGMVIDKFKNELLKDLSIEKVDNIKDELMKDPIAKRILSTNTWKQYENETRSYLLSNSSGANKPPRF